MPVRLRCVCVASLLFFSAAFGQTVDGIAPLQSVNIIDANGKFIGTVMSLSPVSATVAFRLNTPDATPDDVIPLGVTITLNTRDHSRRPQWQSAGGPVVFDRADCTGKAYIQDSSSEFSLVGRATAVTGDSRLWVSNHSRQHVSMTVFGRAFSPFAGEFECNPSGAGEVMQLMVEVSPVARLDDLFAWPFHLQPVSGVRQRSVAH